MSSTPLFHPLKYRYKARLIEKQEAYAKISIQNTNGGEALTHVPHFLIPKEIMEGDEFLLTLQPEPCSREEESEIAKKVLSELIEPSAKVF